jgi:hypothetical protein
MKSVCVIEQHHNIQGDLKVSVHLMITIQKLQVTFEVSPASLQTFIDKPNCVRDDRVQHSMPSVIPNSNYVIMVIGIV